MPFARVLSLGTRSAGRIRRGRVVPSTDFSNFGWEVGSFNNGRPAWSYYSSINFSGNSFSAASPTNSFSKGGSDWGFIVDMGQVYTNWEYVIFYATSSVTDYGSDFEGGFSDTSTSQRYQGQSMGTFTSYGTGYRLKLTRASNISTSVEGGTTNSDGSYGGTVTTRDNLRYVGFGDGDSGISNLRIQGFKLKLNDGTIKIMGEDPGT